MTPQKRVLIALRVLAALRANVRANGNRYSGAFAPNFQSIEDVLTLSDAQLVAQLWNLSARDVPTIEEEAALLRSWGGP